MERTYIKDLRSAIGQTVQINGWLQTLRDQKKLQFLDHARPNRFGSGGALETQ